MSQPQLAQGPKQVVSSLLGMSFLATAPATMATAASCSAVAATASASVAIFRASVKKTLFPNAELNLLSPGSGCPLQAGTGHGRPGRAPGRC